MDLNELSEENTLNLVRENVKKREPAEFWKSLRKDLKSILFLIYLYFLQGVPIGLSSSIPFILSARKVSYADQGTYSIIGWPFFFKIFTAPLVDWIFIKKFGRRKSWLVPVQVLIAIFMFVFASHSQKLVYNIESKTDIIMLTLIFLIFTTLTATQDIALDGWAISMLSKENVSWQSVCNGAGQTLGIFVSNVTFILFESADFCNKYLRPFLNLPIQDNGMVTLKVFMYGVGILFLTSSIIILLKKEHDYLEETEFESKLGLVESYKIILKLIKKRPIQKFIVIFLTFRIGLACENVANLKMIEYGASREILRLITIPIAPFTILLPMLISKYVRKNPLLKLMNILPIKILIGLIIALFVYYTPNFKDPETKEYSKKFYLICLFLFLIQSMIETSMFTMQMGYCASIADSLIGGTYMTFINSIVNIAYMIPSTFAMFLINHLSIKSCVNDQLLLSSNQTLPFDNKCSTTFKIKECNEKGGKCDTKFDAYYLLVVGFSLFGFLWLILFRRLYLSIAFLQKSKWELNHK